jgi:membrane-associated progesterone receptor component
MNRITALLHHLAAAASVDDVSYDLRMGVAAHQTDASAGAKKMSRKELKQYNGEDGNPLYIAIKGDIFDVGNKNAFYAKGGSYHLIAGQDGSRVLATMKLEKSYIEDPSVDGLSEKETAVLNDWHKKFSSKYKIIAKLV